MSIMSQEAKKQLGCVLHWSGGPSSSNAPKQITPYGDVKQLLPFPGAGIGMFDGTGDYVQLEDNASLELGSNNFTIEFLFNTLTWGAADQWGNKGCIIARNQGTWADPGTWTIILDSGGNVVTYCRDCTSDSTNTYSNTGFNDGNWHHLAWVRSGTSWMLFLDGILRHTATYNVTVTDSSNPILIGKDSVFSRDFNGKLSELRISIGVARYTANFTPPRRQLESDSNTKLLIHFNRNDTTFIDSSPSAHTITAYGDAKQLCSPCGSGVAYFDGSGDLLTIADSSVLELGAGNWTIQGRIYLSTIGRRNGIICKNDTTARYPALMLEVNASNRLALTMSSNGSSNDIANAVEGTTTTFAANTWYDIKIVRNGTSIIVYVNGASEISITSSATPVDSSYAWGIGCVATDGTGSLLGYISEFEYASTVRPLTIATQPFAPDPYTKLLLHMDGVGNAFYDSSDPPGDNGFPILPDGVTVTPNGTFAVEKMKDGRNIWAFNGSDNYITFGANNNLTYFGTNDFTLCAWVYSSVFNSATMRIFGISDYNAANIWWSLGVGYNSAWGGGNAINFAVTTGNNVYADLSAANVLTNNAWNHVALVVRNKLPEMYCNGARVTVTSNSIPANYSFNATSSLYIGNSRSNVSELLNGYLKDVMIFKGKALTQDQVAAIMKETYIY